MSTSDSRSESRRPYRVYERDGWTILVGRGARDNDALTFDVAAPNDLWLHVAGWSGSHVIVRLSDGAGDPPRKVVLEAAQLAAWHSKARGTRGKIEVHLCRAGEVRKRRGMAAGKVLLTRWEALMVYAAEPPEGASG